MVSRKTWFGLAFTGVVFFIALAAFVHWNEKKESISRLSSSAVKSKKENRLLELPKITQQIEKVEDEPSALFNDPAINQAWGLKKSDAARAWSISHGSRDIIVAVIDTGIDEKHEDLARNLWTNKGETGKDSLGRDKATNGVDDDANGFIDDVHGWNFVSNNNKLDDNHGHGTHIAGIIGAEAGNGKGIIGIAPEVSLMVLKYYDPKVNNSDNLKATVAAIHYAVKMGAHIINYSGGGTEFSQDERDAIAAAEKKEILFVAAAGNERSNSDKHHYYPADYHLRNIISVTAIDPSTEVLTSSNYGVETVDIAAPGQNILSCLPHNAYGYMTGTSQATAFVTGAAALIMAHRQTFLAEDVKKYILSTGDAQTQLAAKTRTSRQLNLYKALTTLDQGVSASGVTANNTSNLPKDAFSSDGPSLPKMTNDMGRFGHSLINAIGNGKAKPEKLGTKQESDEDFNP